jgi:hypothetical protein
VIIGRIRLVAAAQEKRDAYERQVGYGIVIHDSDLHPRLRARIDPVEKRAPPVKKGEIGDIGRGVKDDHLDRDLGCPRG